MSSTREPLTLSAASRPPSRRFQEQPENCACQEELNAGAEASGAMPTAPMEELAPARAQLREDVLEVGCSGGAGPQRGRVERAAREGEQRECEQAASDFKGTLGYVLVRDPITGKMQRRPECERGRLRSGQCAEQRTGRDMKRDDHSRSVVPARCAPGSSLGLASVGASSR
jgi:hypothetical protein